MNVRAKFRCSEVAKMKGGGSDEALERVRFHPVSGEENKMWSKWTPGGSLEMTISNPAVHGAFEPGEDYFIDITPAKSA